MSDHQPQISWGLRSAIAMSQSGLRADVPPETLDEARRRVDDEGTPAPVTLERVTAWLMGVAGGLNDAPDKDGVIARAFAVMMACEDGTYDTPDPDGPIDGHAFSDDTLVVALRTFDRWPSAAGVYALVRRLTTERRAMVETMRSILLENDGVAAIASPAVPRISFHRPVS